MWIAFGALLLYLALRVVQIKRRTLPFVIAYPLFVIIFLGGGVAVFVGAGWAAVALRLSREVSLIGVYGVTAVALVALWFVARRIVAERK